MKPYFHLHHMLYDVHRDKFTFMLSFFRLKNCPEPQNHRRCRYVHSKYGLDRCDMLLYPYVHRAHSSDPCTVTMPTFQRCTITKQLPLDGRPDGLDSNRRTEVT